MIQIKVTSKIELRSLKESDAQELSDVVDENRKWLKEHMGWLDRSKSVKDSLEFIQLTISNEKNNRAAELAIRIEKKLVGLVSLFNIDNLNKRAAIGYWIAEKYSGQGIMTQSVKALCEYGFKKLKLHRIDLNCGTENIRSAKIAERLKFKREGIAREAEWLYDHFVDHYTHSLLKSEFK